MKSWENKTLIITGASRGIGRAIAHKFARLKANIVIAAKSSKPHAYLPGTIHSVATEVNKLGGKALAFEIDLRQDDAIVALMDKAYQHFSSIDVLINNASAIKLQNIQDISLKNLDLLWSVNARASMVCAKAAIPYLKKSTEAHILSLSPPISLDPKWFKNFMPYTLTKYGMSFLTLGLAQELKPFGISVNSLWPKTTIATSAIEFNFDQEIFKASRKPEIVADAAEIILNNQSNPKTGGFFVDEQVLMEAGHTNFAQYLNDEITKPYPDLFL